MLAMEQSLPSGTLTLLSLNDIDLTIKVVELLCLLLAELGDARRAARMFGASETMRQQADLPRPDPDAALLERPLAQAQSSLGPAAWANHVQAGRLLSAKDAIEEGIG